MARFKFNETNSLSLAEGHAIRQVLSEIDDELQDAPYFAIILSGALRDELHERADPPFGKPLALKKFDLPTESLTPEGVFAVQTFLSQQRDRMDRLGFSGMAAFLGAIHERMAEGLAAGIVALDREQADLN